MSVYLIVLVANSKLWFVVVVIEATFTVALLVQMQHAKHPCQQQAIGIKIVVKEDSITLLARDVFWDTDRMHRYARQRPRA